MLLCRISKIFLIFNQSGPFPCRGARAQRSPPKLCPVEPNGVPQFRGTYVLAEDLQDLTTLWQHISLPHRYTHCDRRLVVMAEAIAPFEAAALQGLRCCDNQSASSSPLDSAAASAAAAAALRKEVEAAGGCGRIVPFSGDGKEGAEDGSKVAAAALDCGLSACSTDVGSDMTEELDQLLSLTLNADLDAIDQRRGEEEQRGDEQAQTQPPCEGELRALANYKLVHGVDIELTKLKAEGLVGKYALEGVNVAGNGAFSKKLKRKTNEDQLASAIFPHLKDKEKHQFTMEYGISESFSFLAVKKFHRVAHVKETEMKGKLITVIALANKLGGYQHKACREGAFNYVKMAYRHCPTMVVRHEWVNMIMVRYYENLITTTSREEWTKETTSMKEETTNEFVHMAQRNKAIKCVIWTAFKAGMKEPTDADLEAAGGVKTLSDLFDKLPEAAKEITLPWTPKSQLPSGLAVAAQPRYPKAKATASRRTAGSASGAAAATPKEKDPLFELKELVGSHKLMAKDLKGLQEKATASPEAEEFWKPASGYLSSGGTTAAEFKGEIDSSGKQDFLECLENGFINNKELSKMKKDVQFQTNVHALLSTFRVHVPKSGSHGF